MNLIKERGGTSVLIFLLFLFFVIVLITRVEAFTKPYEPSSLPSIQFKHTNAPSSTLGLHYAHSGNVNKPGLLFIHGTPGSWDAFKVYLENTQLQKDFFMVSVDRLGWGKSLMSLDKINGDFTPQAHSINTVLTQYPSKKWTLIGHSLGASIAPKVALISPHKIEGLLLLAGSLSPKLGKPRWYNIVAKTWFISRLIGQDMRNSNREIAGLSKQLEIMNQEIRMHNLKANVVIMQGGKDKLVSPKNLSYAAREWANKTQSMELIELENEGHFLPWKQTPLIIEVLYKLNRN